MKKKRNHSIPDFSRKHPTTPMSAEQKIRPAAPAAPRNPTAKPQSTSAKFGRRGQ